MYERNLNFNEWQQALNKWDEQNLNQHFLLGNLNAKIYFLGIASCLGLVFAWLNKDASNLSLLVLLLLWQAQAVGAIAIVIFTHIKLLRLKITGRIDKWWQLAISGVIGSLLFAPIGLLLDIYLGGESFPLKLERELLDEFFGLAPPLIFLWITMNAPWVLGYRIARKEDFQKAGISGEANHTSELRLTKPENNAENSVACPQVAESESFFSLLPDDMGQDIIHMEAELHYLKVVTGSGEALILYNIKDAAHLFGSAEGILCHRSHWVAKKHIAAFKQVGRCGELTLSNGSIVPVSKRKLADYKAWSAN